MPNDIARCHGDTPRECPLRDNCLRYTQRFQSLTRESDLNYVSGWIEASDYCHLQIKEHE